jgi:hypothetical protein
MVDPKYINVIPNTMDALCEARNRGLISWETFSEKLKSMSADEKMKAEISREVA